MVAVAQNQPAGGHSIPSLWEAMNMEKSKANTATAFTFSTVTVSLNNVVHQDSGYIKPPWL